MKRSRETILNTLCILAVCMSVLIKQNAAAEEDNLAVQQAKACDAQRGKVACILYEGDINKPSEISDNFSGVLSCVKSQLSFSNERKLSKIGYTALQRAKACGKGRYGNFKHFDLSALNGTCVQVGESEGIHDCAPPNSNAVTDDYDTGTTFLTGAVRFLTFSSASGIANKDNNPNGPQYNVWIRGACCSNAYADSYLGSHDILGMGDNVKIVETRKEYLPIEGSSYQIPVGVNIHLKKTNDAFGNPRAFTRSQVDKLLLQLECPEIGEGRVQ